MIPDTWNRSSICCKCLSRRLSKVDLASIVRDKGLTSSRQKEGKSLLSHMYHTFQRLPPSLNSSDWAPTVHLGYQTDKAVTETSRQCKERLTIRISDETNAEVEETCVDTTKALLDLDECSTNSDSEKKMKYKALRFYVAMLHIDHFKIKLCIQLYIHKKKNKCNSV